MRYSRIIEGCFTWWLMEIAMCTLERELGELDDRILYGIGREGVGVLRLLLGKGGS